MRCFRAVLAAALPALACAASAQQPALDLFVRADKGRCIACHQLPQGAGPPTRGDIGPRLEGARMRTIGKPALRALITDPMVANPDTVMPPFGKHRILDSAEIERISDFLLALP